MIGMIGIDWMDLVSDSAIHLDSKPQRQSSQNLGLTSLWMMDDSRGGRARLPRLVHECFLGVGRISCLLYFEFDALICFMHSKISGFVF